MRIRAALVAMVLGLMVVPAEAATLTIVGERLTGATGVDVDGTLYDVSFVDGTCILLFDGCDEVADFTFTSLADAFLAATALLDQVFLDDSPFDFDSNPDLTFGCSSTSECSALIPYSVNNGLVQALGAKNQPVDDVIAVALVPAVFDLAGSSDVAPLYVYARFSPTAIPEPATALLVLLGGVGFRMARRRRA